MRPAKSTDHRTERSTYNQSSLALKRIFWDDIPNSHVQKKPETGCTKYSRVRHAKSTNHRTEIYDSYQSRLAQTLFLKDDIYRTITYKRNQKQAVGRRRIKFENKNDSRLQNMKKRKKNKQTGEKKE